MTSLTKDPHPQAKIFFLCRLEDLPRLLRLLPGLHFYLVFSGPEKFPRKTTFRRFFSENPRKQSDAKELTTKPFKTTTLKRVMNNE